MHRCLLVAILLCGLLGVAGVSDVAAQARYDGEDPREKLYLRLGGFVQSNIDSTIRLDSTELGIGTIIDLERNLLVDSSVTVARLEGFYRFNPRHRIEWSFFRTNRTGDAIVLDEDIQIGDTVFEAGARIRTEWESGVNKVSWAYSFINVQKYEFYLGAGINFRQLEFDFRGQGAISGGTGGSVDESFTADGLAPLPTGTFGGRWSFTPKLVLRGRYEFFSLEVGDFKGKLQDSLLVLDYDITRHFGIGGGFNGFNFELEAEQDELRGEIDNSYFGGFLYLAFGF